MLPRLCSDLPGCGGAFKLVPEDFEVEELPAYLPSGEGEHLYLWVEKCGRTTPEVAKLLAKHFGRREREVGYAGLKDRQAVTRQFFSVPGATPEAAGAFRHPDVRVLSCARHRNKLKTGHLAGNRFRVRLRGVRDPAAAQAVLERLSITGLPNFYGEQRFGRSGDNATQGKRLLAGQTRTSGRFERKLMLSALQAELFNRALVERIRTGTLGTALLGDVLKRCDSGGEFVCKDPAREQPRLDRFEVSPAGPIFGPRMTAAEGDVAASEQALLAAEGLTIDSFREGGAEAQGARRPYRVRLEGHRLEPEGEDLWIEFTLPRGSYATVLLRELIGG